jgi:GTPase SAR1 family protein
MEKKMKEKKDSNENFKKEDYITLFEHSFTDIIRLSNGNRELFEELFYNRESEFVDFQNAAEKLYNNGNNILVVGSAGIGKSNYIYRLFYNKELLTKSKLFPLLFDYNVIIPNNLEGWKLHFINGFDGFFKDIDYKINIKENIKNNIDDNLYKIHSELGSIPPERLTKHPILFIDDLDYSEQEQLFEILDFLTPYARDSNIHILLSVRPQLFHAINNNDFKYRFLFVTNVKKIELKPINIHDVLSTRLAPIISFDPNISFFEKIINKFKKLKEPHSNYWKVLKRLGIHNLDSLKNINYPFTDDYMNFMNRITNGNLREIFDIAIDSLCFILDNYNNLDEVEINETTRKHITENQGVMLFYNNPNSKYKLFNIHSIMNNKGNSLHFNVLEALKAFGCPSRSNFYDSLKVLGHSSIDVNNSLKELSRRQNRFIISKNFTYAKDKLNEVKKYEIDEKGLYYLEEVVTWEKYIELCGKSKSSLIENLK